MLVGIPKTRNNKTRMKRSNNLYSEICSMANLYTAHACAKRGKSWYDEVKMVDGDPTYYLGLIQEQLINKTYHTSDYIIFTRFDGIKERTIYKLPYYPDRIVHWAILNVIEKIFIKSFTADTYSAIPKRGIKYGVNRVLNDLKDVNGCKYCLKLDVRKFYPSIDHDILKAKYRRLIKDKDLLWLLDEIVCSVKDGVPIGNYLSQYFGNLYLSSFDHWIKEVKRVKYYHRYMDDIVIFADNKPYLHDLLKDIREYMMTELKLTLKDNYQIFPTTVRGVDFLGYRFFGNKTLLRKRTYKTMRRKMCKLAKKTDLTDSDRSSIYSYDGWLDLCNGEGLRQKYLEPLKARCSK